MNKSKIASFAFILLTLALIVGSAFVIISYSTAILGALMDFATANNFVKMQQCGMIMPSAFNQIREDIPTLILPALYLGIPLLLIAISILMFLAGVYHNKGKISEQEEKEEDDRDSSKTVEKRSSKKQSSAALSKNEDYEAEDDRS